VLLRGLTNGRGETAELNRNRKKRLKEKGMETRRVNNNRRHFVNKGEQSRGKEVISAVESAEEQ